MAENQQLPKSCYHCLYRFFSESQQALVVYMVCSHPNNQPGECHNWPFRLLARVATECSERFDSEMPIPDWCKLKGKEES
jgi:hypothetical protein